VNAPPLLIVGHGTRSDAGVTEFTRLIGQVRDRAAGQVPAVDGGFIELSRPSVADAVARLVAPAAGGPRPIVAVPLVLTAAGHGKGDIPAALARELARHPGLSYSYGRPLGPHPVLQEVMAARIDAVLARESTASSPGAGPRAPRPAAPREPGAGTPRRDVHVVLAARGSTDPDANAEIAKVARLLWEGRGYAGVEFCFISLARPSVPAALERAVLLGARHIVVAPYFLFPGVLPDRVVAQSREFAAGHAALRVDVAGLIGACTELTGLVLERYDEALRGDIRMNCDTCAYRVALPGFADKVGRPQVPHSHPDDEPGHRHSRAHEVLS
jgi:sirohydrochlorin cobaltochelatase